MRWGRIRASIMRDSLAAPGASGPMPSTLTTLLHRLRDLSAPPRHDSDAELLGRFARLRDEGAFAALVGRHGPMVLNACRRVLGDADAAEDAFQATFLVLARRAGPRCGLRDEAGGKGGDLRGHRGVLQQPATPLLSCGTSARRRMSNPNNR